ncbi:MAG TPA: peptidoglycan DD-metalloendopeptidase family protein [Rhodanobacteraceae bacterium]
MRNLIPLSITTVLIAALLVGCATTPAPVVDRSLGSESSSSSTANTQPRPAEHANGSMSAQGYVVARGDTLYSIAFRHGMDYRALAQRNDIGPPYIIHPGQVLRLGEGAMSPARNAPRGSVAATAKPPHENAGQGFGPVENNPPAASTPSGRVSQRTAASSSGVTNLPQVNLAQGSTPSNPSQPVARPGALPPRSNEVQPIAANPPAEGTNNQSTTIANPQALPPAAAGRTRTVDGVTWQWPADGAVISGSDTGLDIAGSAGDPVRAAADGTVVYSGNGLIGYGELIIIKHSDNYLSAYGHNRKRLVQEGQRVRAGQLIAEMGSSGAPREELHFEIRKSGKQVDPTDYLPGR